MKKYINTQSFFAAAAISAVLLTASCKKDFLNVPPQAQQPSVTFWKTPEDALKGVNAIYANLRSWNNVAFNAIAIESTGSDEADKGSTPTDATFFNLYDQFTVTSTHGTLLDFWTGQYQNINLCNQVLDNIPNISMDESLRNRYLAEAKFVRAYSYFRLVRAYGNVVLRLHVPKDNSEYNLPQSDKATVYAQIEKDLNEAAAVLPQSYGAADLGRATKGAAIGLHAKVAMYQNKWADVLSLTNQVMTMGYDLFPDFEKGFRTQNENNIESLFEVQAELVPGNPDASTSQYSQVQGVAGIMGWGFNTPSEVLANAFEAGDPRKDATILFKGETTPQGDLIPNSVPNERYNQKSYVPFAMRVSGFNEGAQQNFRVLRFADILLMNAEAANELGNPSQALTSLNRVRARARGGNNNILPNVITTDKDALRQAIWKERQVELAMENDRYFDVIRQGRAATVFGPKGWKANKNEVWPIPQNEIELSGNLLKQNPGY
ncbi:SusD-like protein BACOVA_02651 [Pedobacter sp. Bi27]|uniref:RagB/SusD family nutrient uptake outer membrane protein n=1 Tax=unclassified Pedobacter TaxID=2628915 RepID=UPI001D7C5EFE|nr:MULTISPECIES: RagB/SusD family nutrient uptake outer membrane protein [unclassified Pedobacter]CAH0245577.1 SusD-like protein BACOVA_02651 [Pedobacter sp. Bi27]CAH0282577.1 SusD-like protein BACOVA_02651 [Pedobacter sp. Bi126]CAH0308736.1 SusD-like protein BACOVA_02651 [Pedobacter sp. Bi36]